MTDKTAFEQYWEDDRGYQMFLRNRIDKSRARVIWNAAIDAALKGCEAVQDSSPFLNMMTPNTVALTCKFEIQKLRSE